MHRIVSGITTLCQHIDTLRSTPNIYRPPCCSNCGHGTLWNHGYYFRKAVRGLAFDDKNQQPIPIPRYLCSFCQRSCSRLPSCIPPRRWYGWLLQQQVLQSLLTFYSLRGCRIVHGLCRSTVRRWWNWLASRTPIFEFFLRSRFPEWGRAIDSQSFWRACLCSMPLSEIMACLDNDGVAVP
jgi:hypothetical protein